MSQWEIEAKSEKIKIIIDMKYHGSKKKIQQSFPLFPVGSDAPPPTILQRVLMKYVKVAGNFAEISASFEKRAKKAIK